MDARQYLEQVRDLHATIVTLQMRLHEQEQALDMLRTSMGDGMPHAQSDGKALENAIVEQMEMMERYTGDLLRWTALRKQALDMFDRARDVLMDGNSHAIGTLQLGIAEMHYVNLMSYEKIRGKYKANGIPIYAKSTIKWYCDQAVEWLGYSRDGDGMPLVPLVSE